MATKAAVRQPSRSPGRLWFGLVASAAAWFALASSDILLTWAACLHQEQFGGASRHTGLLVLAWGITLGLVAVIVTAGGISYQNWRQLVKEADSGNEGARDRAEFMALLGVFISVILGIGVMWMALPLALVDLCVRTR